MSNLNLKLLVVLLSGLLLQMNVVAANLYSNKAFDDGNDSSQINAIKSNKSVGYKAIVRYGVGFIAAGSGGRIDRLSAAGKIIKSDTIAGETFTSLLVIDQKFIVGGNKGTVLIFSENGTYRRINTDTDKNINSLTLFKELVIAGTDNGELLIGNGIDPFRKIKLSVTGNVVSVSARTADCFGTTNQGEIIHTTDGINWDVLDFNKAYAGYYKPCHFTSILATPSSIAVAGIHDDGSPVLLFSNQGNVWSDRSLNYTNDDGTGGSLTDSPNNIYYHDTRDEFYLACNNGKLMKIPTCSHCNKVFNLIVVNLFGISGTESDIVVAGDNYSVESIQLN